MYFRSEINSSFPTVVGLKVEAISHWDIYYPPPPTPFEGEWIGLAEKRNDIVTILSDSVPSMFLYLEKESNCRESSVVDMSDIYNSLQGADLLDNSRKDHIRLCDRSLPNFFIVGR